MARILADGHGAVKGDHRAWQTGQRAVMLRPVGHHAGSQPRAVLITSLRNPRIVALRKLTQRRQRRRQRRFVAEGLQALHMALAAGWCAQEVYHCPACFNGPAAMQLVQRFSAGGARLIEVSEHVMQALSEREAPQGVVATFALPQASLTALQLRRPALVLLLDRLRDPGNMGALLRTADAVGAGAVLLLPPCVDPTDPKVLRAGMGSFFSLPVITVDSRPTLLAWLKQQGLPLIGAEAEGGQIWTEVDWRGGLALALGNEAQGLDEMLAAECGRLAALPLHGLAESLNVAVAGGVLMYAWRAANP